MEKSRTATNQTIKDLIRDNPTRTRFFNIKQIDYCCGGDQLMDEALEARGWDRTAFYEEMARFEEDNQDVVNPALTADILNMPVLKLLDHIQGTHHFAERRMLFEIDKFLNKIMQVHFDHHGPELIALHNLFADLKKELEVHYVKEDEINFPAIREAVESGQITPALIEDLKVLEADHDAVGDLIHRMQDLTDNFTPPADGCMTYVKTFGMLKDLSESIFTHIYKENSVLFDTLERSVN